MSRLAKRTRDGGSGLWLRKADAAWGALVHLVCGDRCAVGGNCAGHVEAHHIISRAVRATRHLPLNGIGLCSKHHKFDVLCSPHGGPAGFFAWFTETYPGRLTELHRIAREGLATKPDYRAACERLTAVYGAVTAVTDHTEKQQ